jgi:hypothetical protein
LKIKQREMLTTNMSIDIHAHMKTATGFAKYQARLRNEVTVKDLYPAGDRYSSVMPT